MKVMCIINYPIIRKITFCIGVNVLQCFLDFVWIKQSKILLKKICLEVYSVHANHSIILISLNVAF